MKEEFVFISEAKKSKIGSPEIGAWTDGIGVFSDDGMFCAYRLKVGKKYKVTIEEIEE